MDSKEVTSQYDSRVTAANAAAREQKYKDVSVGETAGGFQVLIDGRPAYTPERRPLESSRRALMDAIAQEWRAQIAAINPAAMPLTRLLATQLDRVAPQRAAIVAGLVNYIDVDVLCYRAPDPPQLKALQESEWQPVLDWLEKEFAIALIAVDGITPARQSQGAAAALAAALEKLDDAKLTVLQATASLTSSIALSFALVLGRLNAREVHVASHLDELFQSEKWGEDPAAKNRRDMIAADLDAVGRYLELSQVA